MTMHDLGFHYISKYLDQAHDPRGHALFVDAVFARRGDRALGSKA
jgi:hypothetical protein